MNGIIETMVNILVVDDDEQMRVITEMMLVKVGYQVETACDGQNALAKIETQVFDVVVTDLLMDKMNGIDLILNIQVEYPEIKVIAMTGDLSGMSLGMDYNSIMKLTGGNLINKPFSSKALIDLIEKVL